MVATGGALWDRLSSRSKREPERNPWNAVPWAHRPGSRVGRVIDPTKLL